MWLVVGMEYIASVSGGKDSICTIILDHLYEHKITKIYYCEVMFNDEISAEYPEHIDFIKNRMIPVFEDWGYEVVYLKSEKTFLDCFYHVRGERSKNNGKYVGFMLSGHCDVQGKCKLHTIRKYLRSLKEDYVEVLGIAVDEPERLNTAHEKGQVSLLEKYGYTERDALELCRKYDLLSPIYHIMKRSGCFFCPNCTVGQLRFLYKRHRDLFMELVRLEQEPNKVSDTFCYGKTYQSYLERFEAESVFMSIFDY